MSLQSRTSAYPSSSTSSLTSSQSSMLQSRIAQKRAELESLLALRDLSSQLSSQIEVLGEKLSTLDTGFETVAEVMSNWGSILSVLGMVGSNLQTAHAQQQQQQRGDSGAAASEGEKQQRPQTLVRIPVDVPKDVVDGLRDGLEATSLSGQGGAEASGL